MKKSSWRGLIEIGSVLFLFYANLLMRQYERSGAGQKNGLVWALSDIFTSSNFFIAVLAAIIGYILVEFLRTKF